MHLYYKMYSEKNKIMSVRKISNYKIDPTGIFDDEKKDNHGVFNQKKKLETYAEIQKLF